MKDRGPVWASEAERQTVMNAALALARELAVLAGARNRWWVLALRVGLLVANRSKRRRLMRWLSSSRPGSLSD